MRRTFFNSGDIETIMDVLRMSIVEESKQNATGIGLRLSLSILFDVFRRMINVVDVHVACFRNTQNDCG